MDGEPPCCDGQEGGAMVAQEELSPGGVLSSALHRPKRERKQRSYTLCEVCNIQLNSAAQAQIHYNGKSHQKRLKQLSNGKAPCNTGRRRRASAADPSFSAKTHTQEAPDAGESAVFCPSHCLCCLSPACVQ